MLKNILKLDGAQKLSKREQNSINGGGFNGCGWDTMSECQLSCNEPDQCAYVNCAYDWVGWKCLPSGPGNN